MMRENSYGNIPRVYQIFYGEVASLQSYGAFVKIPGCTKQGLVHISQMSSSRVEDPSEMLAKGERVFCKVIAMEGDGQKISLSMKVVNQITGQDLDPNNVQSSQDERKRRQWNFRGNRRIDLGAELNTTCRRCGGHGHLAMDCFVVRGDNHYGLIPELDRLSDQDDELSHRKHRKKDKKKSKKQKTKKRRSSSSSEDSGSEDDHKKRSTRDFSAGHSGKGDKRRHHSKSDSSSGNDQPGKTEGAKWEKYGNRDRMREKGKREKDKGRREKDDSRHRADQSNSDSDSDSKDRHRKIAGQRRDFQQPAHKAWQHDGSRERTDGGGERTKQRNSDFERGTSRREADVTGGRRAERSSEHQGGLGRKRYRSESGSDEDRIREKRGGAYRQKPEPGRYVEAGRERDSFESKDRRLASSAGRRDGERHRREKY